MAATCEHLDQIRVIATDETTCGASKHAKQTEHPIAGSLERGEVWQWCYVDEVIV